MVWVLIIQVWRYLQEAQCPSVPVKEVQGGFELHVLNYMNTSSEIYSVTVTGSLFAKLVNLVKYILLNLWL